MSAKHVGSEQLTDAEYAQFMSGGEKVSKHDVRHELLAAARGGGEISKHAEQSMSSSSSSDAHGASGGLQVYYCAFCGAFALIIDTVLETLPRRATDRALVLEERKFAIKKNLVPGATKLVKRAAGVEKQVRTNCKSCGLFVCYQSSNTTYTYFIADALTRDQHAFKRKIAHMRGEADPNDEDNGDGGGDDGDGDDDMVELSEEEAAAAFAAQDAAAAATTATTSKAAAAAP